MTFTLQSPNFEHMFESRTMDVGEFVQRTQRIDELLQKLADKLNLNQSLNINLGFEVTLHVVHNPPRGRGHEKNLSVGLQSMEADNKMKR